MTARFRATALVTVSLLAVTSPLRAQLPAGFRGDFLRQLADVQKKLTTLAQAMPADKFSWRPGDGVRSVSEVFVHVSGANYFFLNMAGIKPPGGAMPADAEKTITDKTKVIDFITASFEHARKAVGDMSNSDLDKEVKAFGGRMMPTRSVLFVMANHMHEHLGQSIAYARVNGVVPPWSQKQ